MRTSCISYTFNTFCRQHGDCVFFFNLTEVLVADCLFSRVLSPLILVCTGELERDQCSEDFVHILGKTKYFKLKRTFKPKSN